MSVNIEISYAFCVLHFSLPPYIHHHKEVNTLYGFGDMLGAKISNINKQGWMIKITKVEVYFLRCALLLVTNYLPQKNKSISPTIFRYSPDKVRTDVQRYGWTDERTDRRTRSTTIFSGVGCWTQRFLEHCLFLLILTVLKWQKHISMPFANLKINQLFSINKCIVRTQHYNNAVTCCWPSCVNTESKVVRITWFLR